MSYASSFTASELVDWLVQNGEAATREEAVELGQVRWFLGSVESV